MYNIIYADPPWTYENKKTGGSGTSGAATKYPTLSLEEIKNLPVKDIADKDAVLFIWAVVPLLPEAFQVIEAWDFKYKKMITWRKIMSLGMGYWFRGQTEHLLFATKGKVKAFRCQRPNFYECKVGEHSEKPEYFRMLINEAIQGMEPKNKIELFARGDKESKNLFNENKFDGWHTWGNEIESNINLLKNSRNLERLREE
jgi:N6-adenosine-specific RNA methylase IME4